MGRKFRTIVHSITRFLKQKLPNKTALQKKEDEMRIKQKANYNRWHKARNLEPLLPGETVWLPDHESNGTIVGESSPKSYTVQTPDGQFRRNHRLIIPTPSSSTESPTSTESIPPTNNTNSDDQQLQDPTHTHTHTRSGRVLNCQIDLSLVN